MHMNDMMLVGNVGPHKPVIILLYFLKPIPLTGINLKKKKKEKKKKKGIMYNLHDFLLT